MNEPSLTLLASPIQKQTQRCHPVENRPLQILEYARIQSFADNYRFSGTTRQVFEQIGNAVPVNLAKAVAREIKIVLS
jgi:DNA (cytosine-5)-methyltransferase 1